MVYEDVAVLGVVDDVARQFHAYEDSVVFVFVFGMMEPGEVPGFDSVTECLGRKLGSDDATVGKSGDYIYSDFLWKIFKHIETIVAFHL